ncbi:unnamed protein product [Adineta steineri]|uniref:Uncharacterized protein n=1 Tax=Adineta steineri TaxID=433720 RepID=A0A814FMI1_9BILA|nr:unnamed protein product [Adineta steineri]CAF0996905.1 unnamed protein product [Adineta steineri]CAF1503104.1 unnamed protein product [Adineta steineri]CAF4286952.1 unnamed protein product [Adineta steineri]
MINDAIVVGAVMIGVPGIFVVFIGVFAVVLEVVVVVAIVVVVVVVVLVATVDDVVVVGDTFGTVDDDAFETEKIITLSKTKSLEVISSYPLYNSFVNFIDTFYLLLKLYIKLDI